MNGDPGDCGTPIRRSSRARKPNSRFADDELDGCFKKIVTGKGPENPVTAAGSPARVKKGKKKEIRVEEKTEKKLDDKTEDLKSNSGVKCDVSIGDEKPKLIDKGILGSEIKEEVANSDGTSVIKVKTIRLKSEKGQKPISQPKSVSQIVVAKEIQLPVDDKTSATSVTPSETLVNDAEVDSEKSTASKPQCESERTEKGRRTRRAGGGKIEDPDSSGDPVKKRGGKKKGKNEKDDDKELESADEPMNTVSSNKQTSESQVTNTTDNEITSDVNITPAVVANLTTAVTETPAQTPGDITNTVESPVVSVEASSVPVKRRPLLVKTHVKQIKQIPAVTRATPAAAVKAPVRKSSLIAMQTPVAATDIPEAETLVEAAKTVKSADVKSNVVRKGKITLCRTRALGGKPSGKRIKIVNLKILNTSSKEEVSAGKSEDINAKPEGTSSSDVGVKASNHPDVEEKSGITGCKSLDVCESVVSSVEEVKSTESANESRAINVNQTGASDTDVTTKDELNKSRDINLQPCEVDSHDVGDSANDLDFPTVEKSRESVEVEGSKCQSAHEESVEVEGSKCQSAREVSIVNEVIEFSPTKKLEVLEVKTTTPVKAMAVPSNPKEEEIVSEDSLSNGDIKKGDSLLASSTTVCSFTDSQISQDSQITKKADQAQSSDTSNDNSSQDNSEVEDSSGAEKTEQAKIVTTPKLFRGKKRLLHESSSVESSDNECSTPPRRRGRSGSHDLVKGLGMDKESTPDQEKADESKDKISFPDTPSKPEDEPAGNTVTTKPLRGKKRLLQEWVVLDSTDDDCPSPARRRGRSGSQELVRGLGMDDENAKAAPSKAVASKKVSKPASCVDHQDKTITPPVGITPLSSTDSMDSPDLPRSQDEPTNTTQLKETLIGKRRRMIEEQNVEHKAEIEIPFLESSRSPEPKKRHEETESKLAANDSDVEKQRSSDGKELLDVTSSSSSERTDGKETLSAAETTQGVEQGICSDDVTQGKRRRSSERQGNSDVEIHVPSHESTGSPETKKRRDNTSDSSGHGNDTESKPLEDKIGIQSPKSDTPSGETASQEITPEAEFDGSDADQNYIYDSSVGAPGEWHACENDSSVGAPGEWHACENDTTAESHIPEVGKDAMESKEASVEVPKTRTVADDIAAKVSSSSAPPANIMPALMDIPLPPGVTPEKNRRKFKSRWEPRVEPSSETHPALDTPKEGVLSERGWTSVPVPRKDSKKSTMHADLLLFTRRSEPPPWQEVQTSRAHGTTGRNTDVQSSRHYGKNDLFFRRSDISKEDRRSSSSEPKSKDVSQPSNSSRGSAIPVIGEESRVKSLPKDGHSAHGQRRSRSPETASLFTRRERVEKPSDTIRGSSSPKYSRYLIKDCYESELESASGSKMEEIPVPAVTEPLLRKRRKKRRKKKKIRTTKGAQIRLQGGVLDVRSKTYPRKNHRNAILSPKIRLNRTMRIRNTTKVATSGAKWRRSSLRRRNKWTRKNLHGGTKK